MRIRVQVVAVLLLPGMLLLFGCISPISPAQVLEKGELLTKFERTGCQGRCPVFTLKVFFNGLAIYRGEDHTAIYGEKKFSLHKDQLAQIRSAFTRKGFLIMHDQCCQCVDVSGASSTQITYQGNGPYKSIKRYHGCLNGWSRSLENLESEILKITGVDIWVGKR